MSFDQSRILASKRAYRRALAARPIADKLRLLDDLRDRLLAIRHAAPNTAAEVVREQLSPYRPTKSA